jgi:hypothetical protein
MFELQAAVKFILAWVGWLGIGLIPTLICAAAVVFIPSIRTFAISVGVVWVLVFLAYTYGDSNGAARVQEKWDAAILAAVERGTDAREQAERETEPVVDEPPPASCPDTPAPAGKGVAPRKPAPPPAMPGWMRDDIYRRNDR